jgi:hypothetical protein
MMRGEHNGPDELPPIPSESEMEQFVSYCAQQLHLGYGSIKLYLTAVRHRYIEGGHGDILADMLRLKLTLRGIRKVHSKPKRHRIPLTAPMLVKLGRQLTTRGLLGRHEDMLLWAALCVGFFGALRCGEFTDGNLLVEDVTFLYDRDLKKQYVALQLKSSKTDPFRQGCALWLCATNQLLCPYQSLLVYYNTCVRGVRTAGQPLFAHSNGETMSRGSFVQNLHCALEAVGIQTTGLTGHSLRKGLATTAAAAKIEDSLISVMGRWASDCYKIYITTPLSTIADAQQRMATIEAAN